MYSLIVVPKSIGVAFTIVYLYSLLVLPEVVFTMNSKFTQCYIVYLYSLIIVKREYILSIFVHTIYRQFMQ